MFLYLTTTGRVSRLPRTIEIWFVEYEGAYYVVAERRHAAQWVKNVLADPRVTFSIGTRADSTSVLYGTRGQARTIDNTLEVDLARNVSALMDQKYEWSDGLIVEVARS